MNAAPPSVLPATPAARPNLVLAMLLLAYVFNFLDRQILSILAVPIQRELALSDTQMGLLGGLAFALLYSTLAVPLAWIADRSSRSWVIAASLAVWSLFTAACGLAQGFWHIFLARLGVGIGEAGGVAPSYALIADYFPSHQRARALSVYSLGIPLGTALGVLAGAYIAANVNWRGAFLVVGLLGVLLAPVFKFIVRDPVARPSQTQAPPPRLGAVVRHLARRPSFWLMAFGAASSSMVGYGLAFWLPSLLQRSFGLDLVETSHFIGTIVLVSGVAGVLAGGWLADWLGPRDRAYHTWVPAIAYAVCVPLFAAGINAGSVAVAFMLFLLPQGLSYVWLAPVLSATQHLVAPAERATASALFLLINNLIGLGGGIYAMGALSDALAPLYGDEALRHAMIYALGFYGVAALLMALAGPRLRRDWVEG